MLSCLKAELLKCRRSPVWLAFLLLPVIPAVLGAGNYLANLQILEGGWYSLWGQHTLFSSSFFLPALLGVFCSWQWRLEHSDHNWNSFLTAPVPLRDLYGAKVVLAAGIAVLAQCVIGVLFIVSGKIAGISAPLPGEFWSWMVCGALGGICVCVVQLFLSLVFRSFALPVALGLGGGILGLMLMAQGLGYGFPYSLLCLGMRANNPQLQLNYPIFALSVGIYTLVFGVLSLCWLRGRDVPGE